MSYQYSPCFTRNHPWQFCHPTEKLSINIYLLLAKMKYSYFISIFLESVLHFTNVKSFKLIECVMIIGKVIKWWFSPQIRVKTWRPYFSLFIQFAEYFSKSYFSNDRIRLFRGAMGDSIGRGWAGEGVHWKNF